MGNAYILNKKSRWNSIPYYARANTFKFNLYKVPLWAWKRYYKKRQRLVNEALATLKGATNMEDIEGYIPILDAMKLCREHGVRWRASTIQQSISRGVLRGQKLNGMLHVDKRARSDGRIVEFSYPEIDVINGSVASFSLPDTQSALVDPPEMTVQNMGTILTFTPEVVGAKEPVEDKATEAEEAETDANGGIPGFPVWSIGIALIICCLILRKQVFS